MVIKQALPFAAIQSSEFHKLIQRARDYPEESTPSSETLTEIIHQRYLDEIDVLKKELNHSTWASIVLDHWSSQDNKNYIGVIVNFLDKNIEFKSKMVDFHNVKEHGATFTHETLLDLMKNLNIQTKLAGIVGDSTISMVQTMEKTAFPLIHFHRCVFFMYSNFAFVLLFLILTMTQCTKRSLL